MINAVVINTALWGMIACAIREEEDLEWLMPLETAEQILDECDR